MRRVINVSLSGGFVEGTNVTIGPKCNKDPKCNNTWS